MTADEGADVAELQATLRRAPERAAAIAGRAGEPLPGEWSACGS